jgi:2-polyprenyl-3-methyl-5-hydroxy-6-metoxy-1,4-benzoquinol methylase
MDFLAYQPNEQFDLVTCFQVMEHVPDAVSFARKILEIGQVAVVSVPYKWDKGKCKPHIHDPVDERKMLAWFGREPDFQYIATELHKVRRLIHVYTRAIAGPRLNVMSDGDPVKNKHELSFLRR